MDEQEDRINEAFENYLESYLSKEAQGKIVSCYGEAIAARVRAIYDDALKCTVDWRTADIDTALPVLHDLLDSKYPWLSGKARAKIIGAFVMAWK
jgi:hypothetical protein